MELFIDKTCNTQHKRNYIKDKAPAKHSRVQIELQMSNWLQKQGESPPDYLMLLCLVASADHSLQPSKGMQDKNIWGCGVGEEMFGVWAWKEPETRAE